MRVGLSYVDVCPLQLRLRVRPLDSRSHFRGSGPGGPTP
jgi:hypothetical protein